MEKGKQDFLKFYIEHKDQYGFVTLKDISKFFKLEHKIGQVANFQDKNGNNFLKDITNDFEIDNEMLLSRVYRKLGFVTPNYYPVWAVPFSKELVGNDENLSEYFMRGPSRLAVSTSLVDDTSIKPSKFDKKIFTHSKNVFPMENKLESGEDSLTGHYTYDAIKKILKMRLIDTACGNWDRHLHNFFYTLDKTNETPVVTDVRLFDFGASRGLGGISYFNNFVESGEHKNHGLQRDTMIDHFKSNETVQVFLPRSESAEILSSVDIVKEAKELEEETGYILHPRHIDVLVRSIDQMAEELEY